MKTHPAIGADILKDITELPEAAVGAHWHHERYDGKGYPDGLKGKEIPLTARIIGVADAFDAMTSNRSYRNALPKEAVRNEILNGKATQFDPDIADVMLKMIDEGYVVK
jgi:putative two-component system response regulator